MCIFLLLLIVAIIVVIQSKCSDNLTERLSNKSTHDYTKMPSARLPVTSLDGMESATQQSKTFATPAVMLFLNYWNGALSNTSANPDTDFKPNVY